MNEIRVETALGTLVAKPIVDVDYPGIEIVLIRNGVEMCHSMRMEVDNFLTENNEPTMNMLCWDGWDEPFLFQKFTAKDIDSVAAEVNDHE